MKNESVKKSLEKSKNVQEEKRKIVKKKICIKKTHTFTIIAVGGYYYNNSGGMSMIMWMTEQFKSRQILKSIYCFGPHLSEHIFFTPHRSTCYFFKHSNVLYNNI